MMTQEEKTFTEHVILQCESSGSKDVPFDKRREVLDSFFFNKEKGWMMPFFVMLVFSAGIATFGLSQDSAATVIGAMLIAPLGATISALGVAIAVAWPVQTQRMVSVTLAGALLVILAAYFLGFLLPDAIPTAQEFARTTPDLRDLAVALFAGAAGAYANIRGKLFAVLAGVAIAVALVPSLATFGLLLEEGHSQLAMGAFTLFLANFFGITLAAAFVMFVTDFAPFPAFLRSSGNLAIGVTLILSGSLLLLPLYRTYSAVIDSAAQTAAVHKKVLQTASGNSSTQVKKVHVDKDQVEITLTDKNHPTATDFERALT
jgi:uncharacterized hydrophobic protein (TIGR00271 family)